MDKNRQRRFIIDESHRVSRGTKLTAWGVTLFFWGALLYLWQPLVSLIAWLLNIQLFYNHMIVLGGIGTLLDTAGFYLFVVSMLGGGLIVWAWINQWRFRNKNVRLDSELLNIQALSKDFSISPEQLKKYQKEKKVQLRFNNDGKIEKLESYE